MRHAQILHNVGVTDLAEEAVLLLKQGAVTWPAGVHQDGVEELSFIHAQDFFEHQIIILLAV